MDDQWNRFERVQSAALKAELDKEIYECKCSCTWFEQVRVNQFVSEQSVLPGQSVPPFNGEDCVLLRCARCGTLMETRVALNNPTRFAEKKYLEATSDILGDKDKK